MRQSLRPALQRMHLVPTRCAPAAAPAASGVAVLVGLPPDRSPPSLAPEGSRAGASTCGCFIVMTEGDGGPAAGWTREAQGGRSGAGGSAVL